MANWSIDDGIWHIQVNNYHGTMDILKVCSNGIIAATDITRNTLRFPLARVKATKIANKRYHFEVIAGARPWGQDMFFDGDLEVTIITASGDPWFDSEIGAVRRLRTCVKDFIELWEPDLIDIYKLQEEL